MTHRKKGGGWNPYLAGALAGLAVIGAAYIGAKVKSRPLTFNVVSAYVQTAAVLERTVLPAHAVRNAYFKREAVGTAGAFALVAGLFLGALAGSVSGRDFQWEGVPPLWYKRFGPNLLKRCGCGFLGGAAAMFGACLAGGEPIQYGLNGAVQLSVSGMVALVCFFSGGALAGKYLAGKGNRYE